MSARTWSHLGALALLGLIFAALTIRLAIFPGLHGDEAWAGLDALEIGRHGMGSLKGMNTYTGALFPSIAAAQFSLFGAGVFNLRLPGALCNGLAVAILAWAFWRRGHAAFFVTLLFAASLLFLFYSRVAWEVSALQNLLLALILAALNRLLTAGRAPGGWAFLFFFAFALGTWNHFIFLAAAASLTLAAIFLAYRQPALSSARALALGLFNLPLQVLLAGGKAVMPDGAFATHALPAMLAAVALVTATGIAFVSLEQRLSPWLLQCPDRNPRLARRIVGSLAAAAIAGLLFSLPLDGVSFFGTICGFVMQARVASYLPSALEFSVQHAIMAALVAGFAVQAWHVLRPSPAHPGETLKGLLPLWTLLFFPALRLETPHALDRYFIIPQFLFFAALALAMEDLPLAGRRALSVAMALFFLYGQQSFWREMARGADRPPVDFHYGLYDDTSRNFATLGPLHAYLLNHGLCRVQSASFFIDKPLQFLMATGPVCRGSAAVRVEYCDSCRRPVPGFALTAPPGPGKASSN